MKRSKLCLISEHNTTLEDIILKALQDQGYIPGEDFTIYKDMLPDQQRADESESSNFYLDEMAKLNNDLTNMQRELAKANAELNKLVEIRNRFVGMAAHDLRNPMGIIKSFSEFLLQDMKASASEEQLDIINTIRSTAIFMQRLVEGILDISSLQSGRINLIQSEVDIASSIEHMVKLNQSLAVQHNIKIHYHGLQQAQPMNIDITKIRQVVNNLLGNAIKYSPDDSEITCRLSIEGKYCRFCVQDQGVGISAEDQKVIFEPFRKLSSHSTREKSVGLGLYIAKNIIAAHGGELSVRSEPGNGSTFCFTLPLSSR